jgi:hypothetical protein
MTGPAHTNTTTAAAEVLRKHRLVWYPDGASGCDCEALYSGSHEQHQADMLAAASLLADPTTRTEWGAVICGEVCRHDTEQAARDCARTLGQGQIVRRTVTDWTPAEENEHG